MAWVEYQHADIESLASALAGQLHEACERAIALRGGAWLALAGGSTPLPVYRQLASRRLAWPKVSVLPTDERCVPHHDPACNLRAIRAAFRDAPGIRSIALTPPDGRAQAAQAFAREVLAELPQPFDAVVLGMGLDAHTASLFPGPPLPDAALDPASRIDAFRIDPLPLPDEAPYPRVTLSVARLLHTRRLYLVIGGDAKREVLRQAQASNDLKSHPVAAVLHAPGALVHIHWSP